MVKYHVNPQSGAIGVCTAHKRSCPLGGSEVHFTSQSEAKQFGELLMESKYAVTPKTKAAGKLIIFVGLPGSGKSTLSKKLAEEYPGSIILNRDDARTELAGAKYHDGDPDKKTEIQVTALLKERMIQQLRAGGVAIDDNTNTQPRFLHDLVQLGKDYGASVEIRTVDVPLAEVKRRNRLRGAQGGRLVPEAVIDKMASKAYSPDGHIKDVLIGDKMTVFVAQETPGMLLLSDFNRELQRVYPILGRDVAMVDIDGTLSFNHEIIDRNLGVLAPNEKKDWMAFYRESEDAPVNKSVLALLKKLRGNELTIFALTGRSDQHAQSTINFLKKADAPVSRLLMGRDGDFRGDYNVKNTLVDSLSAEGFSIVHSIDDRPSSIRVWEERGISVSRVPYHVLGAPQESYVESVVDDITGQGYCLRCGNDLELGELIHDECRSN
jgi:predicted kinase